MVQEEEAVLPSELFGSAAGKLGVLAGTIPEEFCNSRVGADPIFIKGRV